MEYTLYHNPFSVHSLMVRYTLSLLEHVHGDSTAQINYQTVDQSRNEHLDESFLLKVNAKGQVPVLTSPSLPEPLTDSLAITTYFTNKYHSSLMPEEHRESIQALLTELHEIQPFSLCVSQSYNTPEGVQNVGLDYMLSREDISEEYRRALRFKSEFYDSTLLHALSDSNIQKAESQAKLLFNKFSKILANIPTADQEVEPWMFGPSVGPTVLDGHLVPFIVRLMDAGRLDIIPKELVDYANKLKMGGEWQDVTMGLPTMQGLVREDQREVLKRVMQR